MLQLYSMTHIGAIILGFIEGATEFIPISSSGHLIVARQLLGENIAGGLSFDAILQLATSCALLVYFWRDILRIIKTAWLFVCRKPIEQKEKVLLYAIILGTIPAVIFGLLLEKQMDTIFRNVHLVTLTLIAGSLLFWYAQKHSQKLSARTVLAESGLTVGKGIKIGFYQCLALLPGVSRSGATISGGLLLGLTQNEAVRFSFLLSIPVLFGSGLKKLFEVRHELFSSAYGSALLLGSVVAFVTGLIAINFLIKYLKNHNLNVFIWYRIVLAIIILLFL